MGIFQKMKATKFVLETVPTVPEPWNLILFICSFFLPGKHLFIASSFRTYDDRWCHHWQE